MEKRYYILKDMTTGEYIGTDTNFISDCMTELNSEGHKCNIAITSKTKESLIVLKLLRLYRVHLN